MPQLRLKQIQYECDTWKRLLGFMIDENVYLKTRLSEILKNHFNDSLLEEVESFQSCFLKEDEIIKILRNEIADLDNLLLRNGVEGEDNSKEVNKRMKKLRNNIRIAESQFGQLKMDFNSYLSENV